MCTERKEYNKKLLEIFCKTREIEYYGLACRYLQHFVLGEQGYVNVRFGQFEPRVVPVSNHRRQIRITPYLMDIFPIIPAGNFFGFAPNQKGIEIYGSLNGPGGKGGLEWAVGIVNG
ncbi:MAG: hypothetical protein ACUZ8I_11110 [Candidatus Scalindua sp.]